jgi:hypothetical protein
MVEGLRKAEQARDLLSELERHLAGGIRNQSAT